MTLTWGTLVAICLGVAAVIGAFVALGKAARWGWRLVRLLMAFVGDWFGEPDRPGVPGRPGFAERMAAIEEQNAAIMAGLEEMRQLRVQVGELAERLAAVEAQLKPNGGSSFHDAVNRLAGKNADNKVSPASSPADEPQTDTPAFRS